MTRDNREGQERRQGEGQGQPFSSQGMGKGAKMPTNGENTWVDGRGIVVRAYPCHFKVFPCISRLHGTFSWVLQGNSV